MGLVVASGGSASAAGIKRGLSNGKAATGAPIVIGGIVSITGPDTFSFSGYAAKAYFDCVNANGGLNGRPIKYDRLDDGWNPEQASQDAAKLVNDEKAAALVGNMSFVDCGANQGLYDKAGVMVVAGVGVPRVLASPSTRLFALTIGGGAYSWAGPIVAGLLYALIAAPRGIAGQIGDALHSLRRRFSRGRT